MPTSAPCSPVARRVWPTRGASGPGRPLADLDLAPVIVDPPKIICVGQNYLAHVTEQNAKLPEYPTLFNKFRRTLIGPNDEIVLPRVSDNVDWEVELTIVIGKEARHVSGAAAEEAIFGYTVLNDTSIRDWQFRTTQWMQGKAFESSTPLGPVVVSRDEVDAGNLRLWTELDGQVMQDSNTSDLIFKPADIVAYCSQMITLEPGDVIATRHAVGRRQLSQATRVRAAGPGHPLRCRRDRRAGQPGSEGGLGMMATVEEGLKAQVRNIEAKHGRTMAEWAELLSARTPAPRRDDARAQERVRAQPRQRQPGRAGRAGRALRSEGGGNDPASELYAGKKAALRPVHDRLMAAVLGFGDDVEVAPKRGYLSLRRRKQFAMVQPGAGHVDVGLILASQPAAGRLEAAGNFNAMFSHRVRLAEPENVDPELVGWLRTAYEGAG